MKHSFVVAGLTLLLAACAAGSDGSASDSSGGNALATVADAPQPRAAAAVVIWRDAVDTLAVRLDTLDAAARRINGSGADVQIAETRQAFMAAREAFKHAEVALEYYAPSTARSMNGPALPEVEENEGPEAVFPPTGFQVVEEILYSEDPTAERETLVQETRVLTQLATRAQVMLAPQYTTDDRVWDAVKLELARIVSLGLTGFDSPVAGHGLIEARSALVGMTRTLAPYRDNASISWARVDSLLAIAYTLLGSGESRDAFDHFAFLADVAHPLARELQRVRNALTIGVPTERRAFRVEAASLFDSTAFDAMAFAPVGAREATAPQVALGRQLFRDTRLSGDGTRACSSCHVPERAFTDGRVTNTARGGSPLARNTPTVINSGLQWGSFADLRTTYLEDQVTDVVENVDEMHGSLAQVATVLARDSVLTSQFRAAFSASDTSSASAVTVPRIKQSLAAYQRSLSRLNAPIDRALRGDVSVLSADARAGFNVFVGKAKCATCHFLPLTNGTVPPMYQKTEVEVLGVPKKVATTHATLDPDEGRYRLTRAEPHRYAFRTPGLRNIALTAPYMHNGAYPTLESVIDFYDRGGGAGIGITLDHQTLPPDKLNLTPREKLVLRRFLESLTDTTGTLAR
ncbi:MAG: cytochrome-c peroxidase [Gemmatimonadaceae bacterium]|nr:cytochrome-c peroxidase [Gemmatimonadaceae bacterium]